MKLDINLEEAILNKMTKNEAKYPIETSQGGSKKDREQQCIGLWKKWSTKNLKKNAIKLSHSVSAVLRTQPTQLS